MKKLLVLLVTICVSGTSFAQRGSMFDYGGGTENNRGISEHPFIKDMPKAQQDQLSALKEKFLKDSQTIEQKYEKEKSSLKSNLEKLESQLGRRDDKNDDKRGGPEKGKPGKPMGKPSGGSSSRDMQQKGISPEHAKIIIQAQEIKMQLQEIEIKSRNEIDALRMTIEKSCHKIYKDWVNTL